MWIAATNGHVDLLKMLIGAGGDVNIANAVSLYTIHVTGYLVYASVGGAQVAYCSHRRCVCFSFTCFSAQLLKTRH